MARPRTRKETPAEPAGAQEAPSEGQDGPEMTTRADRAAQLELQLAREQARADAYEDILLNGRDQPRGLAAKMALVQRQLEDVERRGHAEVRSRDGTLQYEYDYILEADLMRAIRPLLAAAGVATFYSDTIIDPPTGEDASTTVRVTLTFVDGDTGEERSLYADGYATDRGDKGANKAKTHAVRYLLWKSFLQPSDEDPEQEGDTRENVARGRATDRAATTSRRRDPATTDDRRPRLRERINQLAAELDTVQGKNPGATLTEILDGSTTAYGQPLDDVAEVVLVNLGQALADHVADQRKRKEDGEPATDKFVLPELPAEELFG